MTVCVKVSRLNILQSDIIWSFRRSHARESSFPRRHDATLLYKGRKSDIFVMRSPLLVSSSLVPPFLPALPSRSSIIIYSRCLFTREPSKPLSRDNPSSPERDNVKVVFRRGMLKRKPIEIATVYVCVWVCVCMHTREKESVYFSRMSDHETIGSGVNEKINANLGRLDRHGTKHRSNLCDSREKFASTFVIRKGTKFDLRVNDPYISRAAS